MNAAGLLVVVPCGQGKIWDRHPGAGPSPAEDAYTVAVRAAGGAIPVTVKMRLGIDRDQTNHDAVVFWTAVADADGGLPLRRELPVDLAEARVGFVMQLRAVVVRPLQG